MRFSHSETLRYARLDTLSEESSRGSTSLILDYHELVLEAPPDLILHDGVPAEHLQGRYVPRRLRFTGVTAFERTGLYLDPDNFPEDHPGRHLQGVLHWYPPEKATPLYLLLHSSTESDGLMFSAQRCLSEPRSGSSFPVTRIQHWSAPPSLPARLIPHAKQLLNRYGGDPISIHLGRRLYHQRLFVGGVDRQPDMRPLVDVVLNLSELPSRWFPAQNAPSDRWDTKGEDAHGMSVDELAEEGRWVIERLQDGKRVLVHCAAGMNRSVSVCCAALIQLEKITAEEALQRVHIHHPWARPDAYHWLGLRWLARQIAL